MKEKIKELQTKINGLRLWDLTYFNGDKPVTPAFSQEEQEEMKRKLVVLTRELHYVKNINFLNKLDGNNFVKHRIINDI